MSPKRRKGTVRVPIQMYVWEHWFRKAWQEGVSLNVAVEAMSDMEAARRGVERVEWLPDFGEVRA